MLRKLLRKMVLREKSDSNSFVSYLRKQGVTIGDDVTFFSPNYTLVDLTCPWLISIGNHVQITHGVIILTHDYSWSVLKRLPGCEGRIYGAQSRVEIGDNVFIGMNAVITRGVKIGDNVVIGAGSVVTSDCEDNSVYAGVPAKRIMSIEEYCVKREAAQFEEAREMAWTYYERFGEKPPKEIFYEYFMLFCDLEEAQKCPQFKAQMDLCANYEESKRYIENHSPAFKDYDTFVNACFE